MKRLFISLAMAVGLSGVVTGSDNQAGQHDQSGQPPQAVHLPDPQDYADDICWVAPEWREN